MKSKTIKVESFGQAPQEHITVFSRRTEEIDDLPKIGPKKPNKRSKTGRNKKQRPQATKDYRQEKAMELQAEIEKAKYEMALGDGDWTEHKITTMEA